MTQMQTPLTADEEKKAREAAFNDMERNVFGQELILVFERFKEIPPEHILFQGVFIGAAGLIATVSSGLYTDAMSHSFDQNVTRTSDFQVKCGISFFGTTPPAAKDNFVYVTALVGVTNKSGEYTMNIEGIVGVVEMPLGTSVDDLLQEANTAVVETEARPGAVRGTMPLDAYANLTSVYSQRARIYTGIEFVQSLLLIAENNYTAIEASIKKTFPNETFSIPAEIESSIWFANLHRYHALEPTFAGIVSGNRNPYTQNAVYALTFEALVQDMETMLNIGPDSHQWMERWYLSLEHGLGYDGVSMLKARLRYTEEMLAKTKIFTCTAFDKYEPEVRKSFENSKLRLITSLQREILSKTSKEAATTVPSPATAAAAAKPSVSPVTKGMQLGKFELEVLVKQGQRVYIEIENGVEPLQTLGATLDMLDVTVIDMTGDDGENYTVWWNEWDDKRKSFVTIFDTEEPTEKVVRFYEAIAA